MWRITAYFLIWRTAIFAAAFLAVLLIPEFGGRFPYFDYLLIPSGLPSWIWGFANFDGVHYLRLAVSGYEAQYTQAFFPLLPMLIKALSFGQVSILFSLVLVNIFFLAALYIFYLLSKQDYGKNTAFKTIILLLAFPTSFYFGSLYSESLFLLLTLGSIYLFKNKKYFLAGVLAALASATRLLGVLLIIFFLAEILISLKDRKVLTKKNIGMLLPILLAPIGLISYMVYLQINFNDPLYFLTAQPFFGAERSSLPIILLPQVLFRYLKMFLTVKVFSLSFFNLFLETLFTILPLLGTILLYKKIRRSYLLFILGGMIIPTLTGTLSSMPRYALISFLMLPLLAGLKDRYFHLILSLFIILQMILVGFFTRGYWVA